MSRLALKLSMILATQNPQTNHCKHQINGGNQNLCTQKLTPFSQNSGTDPVTDHVREAQLGSIQKVVLMLIRESPRCMQKHIVVTNGKDQGQISKAIDKLVEVGLVVRTEGRLIAQ